MKSLRTRPALTFGALLLMGALVTGSGAIALAASAHATGAPAAKTKPAAHPAGPGLMGTLASASGNTLTITVLPAHARATVLLTAKTTYTVNGKQSKTRPTWKKGEQLMIMGTKKNGVYTAAGVMVGRPPLQPQGTGPGGAPPAGGPPRGFTPPVSGTVVSASATTLKLKTAGHTTTYVLNAQTHYVVNGKNVTARPTFKAGQTIHVMATKSGTHEIARMVAIGAMPGPPAGGPPPGAGTNG